MENHKIKRNKVLKALRLTNNITVNSRMTTNRRNSAFIHAFASSVAFFTPSCQEEAFNSVKNKSVYGVPKVTKFVTYIAYLYLITLCCSSYLTIVIATADIEEGRENSDSIASVIDDIPRRVKGKT